MEAHMPTNDFTIVATLRNGLLLSACLACAAPVAADPIIMVASTMPATTRAAASAKARLAAEFDHWQKVQAARSPGRIVELSRAFQRDFPHSAKLAEARELESGASRAAVIHRDVGLSAEFFETTRGDEGFDLR